MAKLLRRSRHKRVRLPVITIEVDEAEVTHIKITKVSDDHVNLIIQFADRLVSTTCSCVIRMRKDGERVPWDLESLRRFEKQYPIIQEE